MEHLTKTEFYEKFSIDENTEGLTYTSKKPCVIDFYADWCGPCRMISPILEELSEEYEDSLDIFKVNVDNEPELASQLGIRSIPLVMYCKPDEKPTGIMGAYPKNKIKEFIQKIL